MLPTYGKDPVVRKTDWVSTQEQNRLDRQGPTIIVPRSEFGTRPYFDRTLAPFPLLPVRSVKPSGCRNRSKRRGDSGRKDQSQEVVETWEEEVPVET